MSTHEFIWNRDRTTRINEVDVDYDEEILVTYEAKGDYIPAIYYPIDKARPGEAPAIEITSAFDAYGNEALLTSEEEDLVQRLAEKDFDRLNGKA